MMPSRIIIMSCLVLAMPFCPRFWMRLIGLANFPRHGIRVQNEQGDVKHGASHMELFNKYVNRKFLL